MSVYLDASVLVALFADDVFTERAELFLRSQGPKIVIGDFAAAEFASAIARKVRTREVNVAEARMAFSAFDAWAARAAGRVETMPADIAEAAAFLRRLDLTLRIADAINIAVAHRIGAPLATFDVKMSACAQVLGAVVAEL